MIESEKRQECAQEDSGDRGDMSDSGYTFPIESTSFGRLDMFCERKQRVLRSAPRVLQLSGWL